VIVRKLTRDWCAGYAAANPALADDFNTDAGASPGYSSEMELLLNSGKILRIAWDQIKWVCYVRELTTAEGSSNDVMNPERLLRRRFSSRPRVAGVWLRLILTDGEEIEGVTSNDRSLIDGRGLLLTPPDTRSNTQRIFVPRSSIRELTVLAVIQPATARSNRTPLQPELFLVDPSPGTLENEPAS
jgi:hypothetical protein